MASAEAGSAPHDSVVIARRFNGPPTTGNGGYVAGRLAGTLPRAGGDAVEVTLRAPIPLDRPLAVSRPAPGTATLHDGPTLLAEARVVALDLDVPAPPSLEAAAAAGALGRMRARQGLGNPYLVCFGCGVERHEADGLRILPSAVGDAGVVASDWTPHPALAGPDGTVPDEIVWAALDCPAGIAWVARLEGTPSLVTGRMTARLDAPVRSGAPHIVTAWPIAREGRKLHAGTALFDADGRLLACTRQLWLMPRTAD